MLHERVCLKLGQNLNPESDMISTSCEIATGLRGDDLRGRADQRRQMTSSRPSWWNRNPVIKEQHSSRTLFSQLTETHHSQTKRGFLKSHLLTLNYYMLHILYVNILEHWLKNIMEIFNCCSLCCNFERKKKILVTLYFTGLLQTFC